MKKFMPSAAAIKKEIILGVISGLAAYAVTVWIKKKVEKKRAFGE